MFLKVLFPLTLIIFSIFISKASHAAIMVDKLNCTAPARGGHIFIATPAPKVKIVNRPTEYGEVTTYLLEANPNQPNSTVEELNLEVAEESIKEGWINLETDGVKVYLKEDNSRALIIFGYGAFSKCRASEQNL